MSVDVATRRGAREGLVASKPVTDDAAAYINRVRAEIEAEAELRRRRDPALQRREREIERAWVEIAPPGAAGSTRELLLDRAERLALVDADAPLGERTGVRQVKGLIRKGTYWYLRYLTDQLNALNNVLTRLLRRFDERLTALEDVAALAEEAVLVDPVPEAGPGVATAVSAVVPPSSGRAVVLGCRSGTIARALHDQGVSTHGVDDDALVILPGVRDGIDLRAGDPLTHLDGASPASFETVVMAGFVEMLAPATAYRLLERGAAALSSEGRIVVVTADPADRAVVDRELRAGRGLSPLTWCHLGERLGLIPETLPVEDLRVRSLVVLRPS